MWVIAVAPPNSNHLPTPVYMVYFQTLLVLYKLPYDLPNLAFNFLISKTSSAKYLHNFFSDLSPFLSAAPEVNFDQSTYSMEEGVGSFVVCVVVSNVQAGLETELWIGVTSADMTASSEMGKFRGSLPLFLPSALASYKPSRSAPPPFPASIFYHSFSFSFSLIIPPPSILAFPA